MVLSASPGYIATFVAPDVRALGKIALCDGASHRQELFQGLSNRARSQDNREISSKPINSAIAR